MSGKSIDKALLDERVQREIEELKLAGRLYQFQPEPRCKVCKQSGISAIVNKLLAAGESYSNILYDIAPLNEELEKKDKVTYSSIRTHALRHFNKDEAAAAVYRRILEKNAKQAEVDFIGGVQNAVTPMAYLETTMNKGYQNLISHDGHVSVELGMQAALKLHSITDQVGDEDIRELMAKTNKLIEVVRQVVPVKYWEEIVRLLEDEEPDEVVDAEVEPVEDDEEFDPDLDFDDEED